MVQSAPAVGEAVASECFATLATLTPGELEALAVYRTHKHCQCEECDMARKVLARLDRKRWPEVGE